MAEKRRGLGRGLGALIPNGPSGSGRPVDVFFPGAPTTTRDERTVDGSDGSDGAPAADATAAPQGIDGATPTGAPTETATTTALDGEAASTTATDPTTSGTTQDDDAADGDVDLVAVPGAHFAEVPVDQIRPNPRQPRTVFDEEELAELVGSIQEIGVLQPVVVRPTGEDGGPRYELIMGERRWRATTQAGLTTIPAIIRETEDHDLLRDALLENLHRSQLNPLEEAAAYQQLIEDFDLTHEQVAERVGKSRSAITNTLRLLGLPPSIQRLLADGKLSAGHARALLGTPDRALQEALARQAAAEGWTVRAVEEAVRAGTGQPAVAEPVGETAPEPTQDGAGLTPTTRLRPPGLLELEQLLADHLDTRVSVQMSAKRGRITIDFADLEDLERIYRVMTGDGST